MKNIKPFDLALFIILFIEIIMVFNFKVILGRGMSMYPTITSSQILLCKYQKSFDVGDIVYYNIGREHIVHRIVAIDKTEMTNGMVIKQYTLKGDNNPDVDYFKVYDENIVCKVLFIK